MWQLQALQQLRMQNNVFTGILPSEPGQLRAPKELYMNNNAPAGILLSELGQLQALQQILIPNSAQLKEENTAQCGSSSTRSMSSSPLHERLLLRRRTAP